MPNYYVFRIEPGGPFLDIRAELFNGRYRQGWGGSGCDLRINTAQTFPHGRSRYDILSFMLKVKPDDRIIVPKVHRNKMTPPPMDRNLFTITVCTAPYRFAPFLPKYNDYGHIIEVDVKGSWDSSRINPYNPIDKATKYITDMLSYFAVCNRKGWAQKFRFSNNKVDDSYYEMRFKEAVEYLIDHKKLEPFYYPPINPGFGIQSNSNSAAQTANSAAQTANSAAQTANSAAQTANSAAQTANSATQTANSATQTANSAAQTANSAAQEDDNSVTPHRKEDELMPNLEDLIENNLDQQRKFWQEVLNNLHTLQPDDVLKAARSVCAEIFEKIVMNLFESDGFKLVADTNCLIFERNTIENAIYEMNGVDAPKIYVLLEKSGISYAEALAQLEQYNATNTRVLIALADDFSEAIKTAAKDKHIMLINGRQFAELIIKYASKSDS